MPENFGAFLTFIGQAGAIGFVLSFMAENWKWFQDRDQQQKMVIMVLVSFGMGVVSKLLVKYVPAGVVAGIDEYYQVFIATLAIVLSSQIWHKVVNQSYKPREGVYFADDSGDDDDDDGGEDQNTIIVPPIPSIDKIRMN